jgi:hypothetical protein
MTNLWDHSQAVVQGTIAMLAIEAITQVSEIKYEIILNS